MVRIKKMKGGFKTLINGSFQNRLSRGIHKFNTIEKQSGIKRIAFPSKLKKNFFIKGNLS